jgi:hypothetical protein
VPSDPNARRDSLLAGILSELKEHTKLLKDQNKVLGKIEQHGRPTNTTPPHPYLDRSTPPAPTGTAEHVGPYGSGVPPYS